MIILGIDPGLAHVGLALCSTEPRWCELRVIDTQPRAGGAKTEDDLRRYTEIAQQAQGWINSAAVIGMEAYSTRPGRSGNRSAGAGTKTAVVFGLLLGLAQGKEVHIMHPQQTRARLGLKKGATKEDVHHMAGLEVQAALEEIPKSKREHAGDALALAVAAYHQHRISVVERRIDWSRMPRPFPRR